MTIMNPIDIEVSFTRFSSPLGWLILASTEMGLCIVQFCGKERPSETCMRTQLQRVLPRSGLRADETPLREAIKALRHYFG